MELWGGIVSDVREFDAHGVSKEKHGGSEFSEDGVKIEIVVRKDQSKILGWLNISAALHNNVIANFQQFEGLCGKGIIRYEKFSAIWFACIWVVWKG
ncbi:hypothetical protein TSUD_35840 [Trifolium subterraneum]|uniref:Uncharacterized protein n=1 Tax=Trifolium subterraneum TaxID=3900 RepID=A0A2Z6PBJ1_TRISU|nr:hypothetical protein TSUD_35840 [Trifolium subterraneum]